MWTVDSIKKKWGEWWLEKQKGVTTEAWKLWTRESRAFQRWRKSWTACDRRMGVPDTWMALRAKGKTVFSPSWIWKAKVVIFWVTIIRGLERGQKVETGSKKEKETSISLHGGFPLAVYQIQGGNKDSKVFHFNPPCFTYVDIIVLARTTQTVSVGKGSINTRGQPTWDLHMTGSTNIASWKGLREGQQDRMFFYRLLA